MNNKLLTPINDLGASKERYPFLMSSLLALLSSLLFGSGDYIGGHLTKKHNVVAVAGAGQVIGFFVGISLLLATRTWIAPSLSWSGYFLPGVCAGLVGFVGLNAFFAGLATGRMGVVSPITSLSVLIPVLYSIVHGERPTSMALTGMAIAILGAFFGSGPEINGGLSPKPILLAVIAAICFGIAVLLLTHGSQSNVLMTAVTMRFSTVLVMVVLALRFKTLGGFEKSSAGILLYGGASDFLANVALGEASTMGLVSSAVVLSSLYPVVTTLLAFKYAHERLHKLQYLGIAMAIAGVSLISLS